VWVIQSVQIKQKNSLDAKPSERRKGVFETIRALLRDEGISVFFRGLGPALVLVLNPIIQYTVFEQMKNFLIKRRTARLRAAGGVAAAVAILTDWDYFFLGALSKLGEYPHVSLSL
jgi:solute carrier family 25 (peroxisomal adenine nucleotide transporter), member 17